ncbi:hypothetical protein MtrunA17_Chr6g0478891 [Medicago truncatula]|uniref:Transmembrane protein n=1 Tax=Medicago truncatula TaxID=3880 RepID=A0A396HI50_MEDTR|nr:hypothetical protein MtrunA17_Chr6g0478891 [Medicago truncatula]
MLLSTPLSSIISKILLLGDLLFLALSAFCHRQNTTIHLIRNLLQADLFLCTFKMILDEVHLNIQRILLADGGKVWNKS